MRKVHWIVCDQSHRAMLASESGYVNLVAEKRSYTVEFVGDHVAEPVVNSSPVKNLRDAKALSVAHGQSLLSNLQGCSLSREFTQRSARIRQQEKRLTEYSTFAQNG